MDRHEDNYNWAASIMITNVVKYSNPNRDQYGVTVYYDVTLERPSMDDVYTYRVSVEVRIDNNAFSTGSMTYYFPDTYNNIYYVEYTGTSSPYTTSDSLTALFGPDPSSSTDPYWDGNYEVIAYVHKLDVIDNVWNYITEDSYTYSVSNPPSVTIASQSVNRLIRSVQLTIDYSDPGYDAYYIRISWGDGTSDTWYVNPTTSDKERGGGGSITATHIYEDITYYKYTITITICDGMNNSDSTSTRVDFGGWPGF